MLAQIYKAWCVPLVAFLLFSTTAQAANTQPFPLEPVWEKIDGEWNFNKIDKSTRHVLIHITTTKQNKQNKNLLIKELVKLPFVVFIPQQKRGALPLSK